MKKVYKYATGEEIPEGSVYLATITNGLTEFTGSPKETKYVWHYFLVEVQEDYDHNNI